MGRKGIGKGMIMDAVEWLLRFVFYFSYSSRVYMSVPV